MTVSNLPAGFRHEDEPGSWLIHNTGPHSDVAGRFGGSDAAALWSGQVLSYSSVRAVVVVPARSGPIEDQFEFVHTTAEQIGQRLTIGAVEVAVVFGDMGSREVTTEAEDWTITALGGGSLLVLLTDADVNASVLQDALDQVWPDADTVVAMASGAGGAPGSVEFTAALFALHEDAR